MYTHAMMCRRGLRVDEMRVSLYPNVCVRSRNFFRTRMVAAEASALQTIPRLALSWSTGPLRILVGCTCRFAVIAVIHTSTQNTNCSYIESPKSHGNMSGKCTHCCTQPLWLHKPHTHKHARKTSKNTTAATRNRKRRFYFFFFRLDVGGCVGLVCDGWLVVTHREKPQHYFDEGNATAATATTMTSMTTITTTTTTSTTGQPDRAHCDWEL